MVRWATIGRSAAIATLLGGVALAQTHKVAKPENVVRAIGVFEWTGDLPKPAASRLIPVSLFIDGKLEDAAVYLARPVPFSLLTGNVYELEDAGKPKGVVDLLYSRRLVAADTAATTFDDGWFGYGTYVPPAAPKKQVASAARPARTVGIVSDADDDKPHFSSKSAAPGTGGAASGVPDAGASTPASDPDRPTMKRHTDDSAAPAGSGSTTSSDSTVSSGSTPAGDPDRPTMRRHSDSSDQTASSGSSGGSSGGSGADAPADDADRPTLRRRSPEDAKKAKNSTPKDSVTGGGDALNDDPNRPNLHRGKPVGAPSEADFPKLSGLPGDEQLHQMVAVSDAANRPEHDFTRAWDDEAEHQAILGKMQVAARLQLTAYETANGLLPKPATPAPADARHPNSKLRRGTTADAPPAPPELLLGEQLKAYTLSYGGAATYVYSAHTDGLGSAERFVTLVAQVNGQGEPQIAMKSVTDATHLDRTPRMKLVDAVDAEASNRASLLFELREQGARQFALYRVIGARAEQTFATGTTQ